MAALAWHEKAALSVTETGSVMSLSRQSVYRLIHDGHLRSVQLSGKTLVPVPEILRVLGIEKPPLPTAEEVGLAILTYISDRALPGRQPTGRTVPTAQPVASGERLRQAEAS